MPPCPDFEHDWVEHRHPDGWQLELLICRLCGKPQWGQLISSMVEHYVIPAEESGRRAALGRPDSMHDAVQALETAAEVAMAAGVETSAHVAAFARRGAGRWLRKRQVALDRHRRYPQGKGMRWRWTVLRVGPVQVKVAPRSWWLRVWRLGFQGWYTPRDNRFAWPTMVLLALENYSNGWGVQVWPRLRLVASWYPKDMSYDRPGVFRTPARPHER